MVPAQENAPPEPPVSQEAGRGIGSRRPTGNAFGVPWELLCNSGNETVGEGFGRSLGVALQLRERDGRGRLWAFLGSLLRKLREHGGAGMRGWL
jgi:hypothetical protein